MSKLKRCPRCHYELKGNEKYCPICGLKLSNNFEKNQNKILDILKGENITVKEALKILDNCKSSILNNMPFDKNLNDKFTW